MSPERKALKIVCFLYVLDALACVAAGGLSLAGAGALPDDAAVAVGGVELALVPCSIALGVLLIGSGALFLALSGAGIRGANRPRQIGGLLTLGVLIAVMQYALRKSAKKKQLAEEAAKEAEG